MFGYPLLMIVLGVAMLVLACFWWNFYFRLEARRFGRGRPVDLTALVMVLPFLGASAFFRTGPILSAITGIASIVAGVVMFFI